MKSNLPLGCFHQPLNQQSLLSSWFSFFKKTLSKEPFQLFFFLALEANAQIDYGAIKPYDSLMNQETLYVENACSLTILGNGLKTVVTPFVPCSVGNIGISNNTVGVTSHTSRKDSYRDFYC